VTELDRVKNRVNEIFIQYPGVKVANVELNGRLKSTAGRAFYKEWKVDFNTGLLASMGLEKFDETIVHECAHLIAYAINGYRRPRQGTRGAPHGKLWRNVMANLGYPNAKATWGAPVTARKRGTQRRWDYSCDCAKNHKVATVTHNRIQRGVKTYRCSDCETIIKWTGKEIV